MFHVILTENVFPKESCLDFFQKDSKTITQGQIAPESKWNESKKMHIRFKVIVMQLDKVQLAKH